MADRVTRCVCVVCVLCVLGMLELEERGRGRGGDQRWRGSCLGLFPAAAERHLECYGEATEPK